MSQAVIRKSHRTNESVVTPTANKRKILDQYPGVELMDISSVQDGAKGFSGMAFDGRFNYYAPLNNGHFFGQVCRYDTQLGFTDGDAWSTFDCAELNAACRGFTDAIYDGRYVTLIPFCNGQHHGHVTRYDTQKPFHEKSSWEYFDITQLNEHCRGFVSGCFDGRYIVFSPYQLDFKTHHGCVARFDTLCALDDKNAWQWFDTAVVNHNGGGFHSAIASDDYVYLVPYCRAEKSYNDLLLRYKKSAPFTDPSAWQSVELSKIEPMCRGFIGGVYRQGKIYLAPYFDGEVRHGRVMQFDESMTLEDPLAWQVFDSTEVNCNSRGFFGAICDEHYLYLLPHCRGVNEYHGQITRYQFSSEFTDKNAWSTCDLTQANELCKGFIGGVIHQGDLFLAPFETQQGCPSGLTAKVTLNQPSLWGA